MHTAKICWQALLAAITVEGVSPERFQQEPAHTAALLSRLEGVAYEGTDASVVFKITNVNSIGPGSAERWSGADFAITADVSRGDVRVTKAPSTPWQNPYVERLIGSIRRECLDHVMVWNRRSLPRIMHSYFAYYHRSRTHLAGEGLARAARDAAARNGIRRGLATGRRTAPPLRTTGRLRATLVNGGADEKFQHDPPRPRS